MALIISADARSAKLQTAYQNLSASANTLNTASNKFSDAAHALDEALNKLSPGVTAWVTFTRRSKEGDSPYETEEERLGFAKINNKWGLSLCRVTRDNQADEEEITDQWLFNDAPRNLRLEAIQHVPELVEALAREAEQMAKRVSVGADLALQLAASISKKGSR